MYEQDYDDYDDYEYGGHTGDPLLDREYERHNGGGSRDYIPEAVKKYLTFFRDMIEQGNTYEIFSLYEHDFPKLTMQFFKSSPWPEPDAVQRLIDPNDDLFLILYKEMYFRHIYARVKDSPTVHQRLESYGNYCDLFNYILASEEPSKLELPSQWLWEIIDEFIYQFQEFQQFRSSKLNKMTEMEYKTLVEKPQVWDVLQVLNVLHVIVDRSNINKQLEVYSAGGNPDTVAGKFGSRPLYKKLGYFCLVGLLRLHSLFGDYYQAIKVLENIELNKKGLHSQVHGCQITMYYYVGFAYMMMRRYADAIKTFSDILLFIQRTKSMLQTKSFQNDQILKQTDKMCHLLAICLVLHPERIDESLHAQLKEKTYAEKINKMQQGHLDTFEECFKLACPKFLALVPPSYDMRGEIGSAPNDKLSKEPRRIQLQCFLDEVEQQKTLSIVRSYLKLYTSMPLDKLSNYMGVEVDTLTKNLLCFKHKMRNLVWTKGSSGLGGAFQSQSEVDFYIDANMIHIADTKVDRRYGDYFIRQIHKFQDLNINLKNIKM